MEEKERRERIDVRGGNVLNVAIGCNGHIMAVNGHTLTTTDLQRRSCMLGDQKVTRPSWLQQMNEPSAGVSRTRRTGSRCGVGLDLAGSWKPTCRARTYESCISPYSSCMYVQNSSHVMPPCDVQSIFWNNVSI